MGWIQKAKRVDYESQITQSSRKSEAEVRNLYLLHCNVDKIVMIDHRDEVFGELHIQFHHVGALKPVFSRGDEKIGIGKRDSRGKKAIKHHYKSDLVRQENTFQAVQ